MAECAKLTVTHTHLIRSLAYSSYRAADFLNIDNTEGKENEREYWGCDSVAQVKISTKLSRPSLQERMKL